MKTTDNTYKYAGLFVAMVLPVLMGFFKLTFSNNAITDTLIKESIVWSLFFMLIIIARYGEKEPLAFSTNNMSLPATLGLSLIIVLSFFVFSMFFGIIYMLIFKSHPPQEAMLDRFKKYPMWLKLILALRAGIVEETFFRAYAMSRIKQLTNNNFLAFIIPLMFFAAGHYVYGTITHIVGAFFIGGILAAYYLQRKNLIANIIAHSIFDLLAFAAKYT